MDEGFSFYILRLLLLLQAFTGELVVSTGSPGDMGPACQCEVGGNSSRPCTCSCFQQNLTAKCVLLNSFNSVTIQTEIRPSSAKSLNPTISCTPLVVTTTVMVPCSDDTSSPVYLTMIVCATILIIALILAGLVVICILMKMKQLASRSHDGHVTLINGPAGTNSSGLSSIQEGGVRVTTQQDYLQHVQNQAYEKPDSDTGLQHTYATLEPPPSETCFKQGALYNPAYLAGTSSLGPTTGLQGQDEDALAADYLDPVATLPLLSAKNGKIEAASSNCREKGDDQVNELELGVLSSQKSDLLPEPGSSDGANEEKSQEHAYATLCEATIKE